MVRRVTTLLMVASVLLTATLFFEARQPPARTAPTSVRRAFAVRLRFETMTLLLSLVGAGVGAALISREAKRSYREASMRNLQGLVEGEEE